MSFVMKLRWNGCGGYEHAETEALHALQGYGLFGWFRGHYEIVTDNHPREFIAPLELAGFEALEIIEERIVWSHKTVTVTSAQRAVLEWLKTKSSVLVLYGPPMTGKTYAATRSGVRVIDNLGSDPVVPQRDMKFYRRTIITTNMEIRETFLRLDNLPADTSWSRIDE